MKNKLCFQSLFFTSRIEINFLYIRIWNSLTIQKYAHSSFFVIQKGEEMIKHLWHTRFVAPTKCGHIFYGIKFEFLFTKSQIGSKQIKKNLCIIIQIILQRKFHLIVYSSLLIYNSIFQLAKNKKITSRYFWEHIF